MAKVKRTYAVRYVAGQPVARVFTGVTASAALKPSSAETLPCANGMLRVMVWNIFKQHREEWLSVLKTYGDGIDLILLQEAQTTPELIKFATTHYLVADQIPAVILPLHPSGVMTLAAAHPVYCCPLREREPLLRLSKSALITVYPLHDGRLLMVINIHAVNFSFGVHIYSRQLDPIGQQIATHQGPIIMAGDFNAWSRKRINALYHFARRMGLREVHFRNDQRSRAFGRPLDFIFYQGLRVAEASVLVTRASDHNPLLVTFE